MLRAGRLRTSCPIRSLAVREVRSRGSRRELISLAPAANRSLYRMRQPMASKHSTVAPVGTPRSSADNFKLIHGIGPAIERHLHSAGILTYVQLAAISPEELAALLHGYAGVSAQQIAKHDWIGQAREL